MVIRVGDSRVYRFEGSTVICEIYHVFAEVLVLPERRKFVLRFRRDQIQRLSGHPDRTLEDFLATHVANGLRDCFLQVDEEVSA